MIGIRRGLDGPAAAFRFKTTEMRAPSWQWLLAEEFEMLLHLPIAVLATVGPIGVSDPVPKFDIAKECRFESESSRALNRCAHDETEAFGQLQAEWPQFADADRSACFTEATVAGFASYVELLICLEMARDVRNDSTHPGGPPPAQSTPAAQPEMSVVDQHP